MKSLKAREAERKERKEREDRIAARSAAANRTGNASERYPAELDPAETTNEAGSEGDAGAGEDKGNKKPAKGSAGWTPNA